jgi:hypothetical protein
MILSTSWEGGGKFGTALSTHLPSNRGSAAIYTRLVAIRYDILRSLLVRAAIVLIPPSGFQFPDASAPDLFINTFATF